MYLRELALTNFKNIPEARMEFSPRVNCLLGNNGMGKSNMLDAIHFLSCCRSFTRIPDRLLIRSGETFATGRALYNRRDVDEELSFGITFGKRKSFKRGGKEYSRLSNHIGLFPLVMTSPVDIDLIRDSAEVRRMWLDMLISQSSPVYLDALIRYGRALEQRNSLLRDGSVDPLLYEAVETVMDASAAVITIHRREKVDQITEIFRRYYALIAHSQEMPSLRYAPSQGDSPSLQPLLDSARRHDEIVRHTSVGPHRDDVVMLVNDMPAKNTASQGQSKTFVTALKLAQYDFLKQCTGLPPLLLLDDVFDKLDASRVECIMNLVTDPEGGFGQIFITDTNRKHLDEIMSRTGGDYRMWDVRDGSFTPIH